MKQRILGRTGLSVSEICLGTLNFGWATDRETSERLLDHFADNGGNFIQAAGLAPLAPARTNWTSFSEAYVGEWLRQTSIPRSQLVISSRISLNQPSPSGSDPLAALSRAVDESLRRLQTGYIDLLLCQWHPAFSPLDAVLGELTQLVQSGKVRYFGFSDFPLWRVMESIERSTRKPLCRVEAFQADYSLLERNPIERDAFDLCREYRLSFLARSPLAGGFLAARTNPGDPAPSERSRWLRQRYGNRRGYSVYSEVEAVAYEHQASSASVALAWVLKNPVVTSAIIGARTVSHLRDALHATRIDLSYGERHRLDAVSAASAKEHRVVGPPARPAARRNLLCEVRA